MLGGCPSVGLLGVPVHSLAVCCSMSLCLPQCPVFLPGALEEAVSLSGLALLNSSYAPAQL